MCINCGCLQELALYIGFTIGETFRYFGWLTGVPKEEIAQRTATLLKFLDLPSAHCMIGQLRFVDTHSTRPLFS